MGLNQKMVGNSNIYTIECFENIFHFLLPPAAVSLYTE